MPFVWMPSLWDAFASEIGSSQESLAASDAAVHESYKEENTIPPSFFFKHTSWKGEATPALQQILDDWVSAGCLQENRPPVCVSHWVQR